ncbi:hypothetical protein GF319_04785, partial [Candidatus Bathyarchaeota archaeon]|nr:hypothetical protein [Candidatus Bathyarchaeota archaeon]
MNEEGNRSVGLRTIHRVLKYVTGYWELKAVLFLIGVTTILSILSPAIIGGIIDMIRSVASGGGVSAGEGVEKIAFE